MRCITAKELILTLTIFLGLFFSAHSAEAGTLIRPPNNLGLVGYWNFNEGTSTVAGDYSGSGNNGTLTNISAPATAVSGWTENGKLGNAINFDGSNDYVKVKDGTMAATLPTTTISIWFKAVTGTSPNGDSLYSERAASGGDIFKFDYGNNLSADEEPFLTWRNDAGSVIYVRPTTTTSFKDGRWHHFVVVVSGVSVLLYTDGVANGSGIISTKDFTNAGIESYIGGDRGDGQSRWLGGLDELRIYDRALSQAQIAALYNSGGSKFGGSNALTQGNLNNGLVGHWTFDGKDMVPDVRDVSGNGNHGTLANFPATTTTMGKLGQALNFINNNSDNVNAGSGTSTDNIESQGGGGMSAAFWMYPITDGSFGVNTTIIAKGVVSGGSPTISNGVWAIQSGNRHISLEKSFDTTVLAFSCTNGNQYSLNQWAHHVVTWTGSSATSSIKCYRDGVDITAPTGGTAGVGTLVSDAASNLAFGSGQESNGVHGALDDVRLYNRILSPSEIKQLYSLAQGKTNASSTALSQGTSLKEGLVGLWTFDGQDTVSSITDRSGQGNNGYFVGGATSSAKTIGKMGQALSFNGSNQYVDMGDTVDATGDFTVSAWINRAGDSPGAAVAGTIIGKEINSSQQYIVEVQDSDTGGNANKIRFILFGVDITQYSTGTITNDTWYHIVTTYNDTTKNKTIYINGDSSGTVIGSGSPAGNSDSLRIGYSQGTSAANNYFNGKIDDVRLYNRVLSSSEVKQLYMLGN